MTIEICIALLLILNVLSLRLILKELIKIKSMYYMLKEKHENESE